MDSKKSKSNKRTGDGSAPSSDNEDHTNTPSTPTNSANNNNNNNALTGSDDRPKRARKQKRFADEVELSREMKLCQRVLNTLLSNRISAPFAQPVDPIRLKIPDYFTVIKHPMDLGTIRDKLANDQYHTVEQFTKDVELVFSNCETYNAAGSDIVALCKQLRELFNQQMALAHLDPASVAAAAAAAVVASSPVAPSTSTPTASNSVVSSNSNSASKTASHVDGDEDTKKRVKKRKIASSEPKAFTYADKTQLARSIEKLKDSELAPVVSIFVKHRQIDPSRGEDLEDEEFVIDLDLVNQEALQEIATYVYSVVH